MGKRRFTKRTFFQKGRLLLIPITIILYFHYFLPQHWNFFLVKPRGTIINVYPVINNKAEEQPLIKNNVSYGFGMSRKARVMYNELSKLIRENNKDWKILAPDSIPSIVKEHPYIIVTGNQSNFYKGKFLITKGKQLSFTSISHDSELIPEKEYLLLEIK